VVFAIFWHRCTISKRSHGSETEVEIQSLTIYAIERSGGCNVVTPTSLIGAWDLATLAVLAMLQMPSLIPVLAINVFVQKLVAVAGDTE
jgi:hypothetical protein